MKKIRNLLIFVNRERDRGMTHAGAAADEARALGVSVETVELGIPRDELSEAVRRADMVATFGGDGTLLAAATVAAENRVPVLGVNLGKLGFMTAFGSEEAGALARILGGDYLLDRRMMLRVRVLRGEREVFAMNALNDACVTARELSRTITLEIHCDGSCAATLRGDGVIAATPTGSTAYSLSAGGPVIDPRTDCMVFTPICAHTPYARPMVIPAVDGAEIHVPERAALTVDGQRACDIEPGDRVVVSKSDICAELVRGVDYDFYGIMRRKLWNGQ